MSVTLSYDATLSRVRVEATGLGGALTALVERSIDQITWTVVRGGMDVPVTAGAVGPVDDYEFTPGVVNHYRLIYTAAMSFVSAGAAAHGNYASVVPGLPAGLAAGDVMFLLAAIRNSGAGVPSTPAGWTPVVDAGNMRLWSRIAGSSESAPTVAFTGGVAGADTSAQIAAVRGVDPTPVVAAATQLNASAQDISAPAVALPAAVSGLSMWLGWKQDDWTSVDVVASGIEIGEPDTTTGDDQGIVWDYRLVTLSSPISSMASRTFVVTGGAPAISRSASIMFPFAMASQAGSITPTLDTVWVKNLARPFLNRSVRVSEWSDPVYESRSVAIPIIGRRDPIGLSDVRLAKRYELTLLAHTVAEADELVACLASGEPVLIHRPGADCPVPGGYGVVGDVTVQRITPRGARRLVVLPITETAAPGSDVVGATMTWQTVISAYATWADLIAAQATWQDVLDGIADPGDVVVG